MLLAAAGGRAQLTTLARRCSSRPGCSGWGLRACYARAFKRILACNVCSTASTSALTFLLARDEGSAKHRVNYSTRLIP